MMTSAGNPLSPSLTPSTLSAASPVAARFFALVPCAGQGSRAGAPVAKQYQPVAGRPLVAHTIAAFQSLGSLLSGIRVVVSPGDGAFADAVPSFGRIGETLGHEGGATRADTVRNGLLALLADEEAGATPGDWVLVHDAARCLVTPAQVRTLIDACRADAVGGLLAQPLPDTLKQAAGGRVGATVDRSDKWLAQTPQMFRIGALLAALDHAAQAGVSVTDEASAMEAIGLAPLLVPGSAHNFKVTYPEDFALAEALLLTRRRQAASPNPAESLST